jgi:drug/metabolite transporter (DMT)-like permease
MGQAAGLLFSKIGMAGGFSPISANLIRVTAAAAAMLMVKAFSGALRSEIGKMKDRRALLDIVSGAAAGPVLGVVLSLYAITHAHMGVAATLMSLAPVILLLHTHFILKEKITFMAVGGTLLALVGTALLFIVG